jgi:hypothetical protein
LHREVAVDRERNVSALAAAQSVLGENARVRAGRQVVTRIGICFDEHVARDVDNDGRRGVSIWRGSRVVSVYAAAVFDLAITSAVS